MGVDAAEPPRADFVGQRALNQGGARRPHFARVRRKRVFLKNETGPERLEVRLGVILRLEALVSAASQWASFALVQMRQRRENHRFDRLFRRSSRDRTGPAPVDLPGAGQGLKFMRQ